MKKKEFRFSCGRTTKEAREDGGAYPKINNRMNHLIVEHGRDLIIIVTKKDGEALEGVIGDWVIWASGQLGPKDESTGIKVRLSEIRSIEPKIGGNGQMARGTITASY